MKLKVISPIAAHAQAWADALSHAPGGLQAECIVKPLPTVNVLVNGSRPDLVVVETTSPQDFNELERLARQHPEIEYVLVGSELTRDELMRAMRAGVRELLPPDASANDVVHAVQRLAQKRPAPTAHEATPARRGQVLAFIGCKGGSGATFAAANLAHVLAAGGQRRVALIDLNLQFGDALFFLSSERAPSNVAELARNIGRLDRSMLEASMVEVAPGLRALAAPEDPAQAADVAPEHVATLVELARTVFDHVVIDVGRSLTGVTLQALDQADHLFAVLQLTLPYIRGARRLRDVFRSLGYADAKQHWVVNRYEKSGQITLDDLRRTLAVTEVLTLPNQYDPVASAVNQGVAVSQIAPNSAISKGLRELAAHVAPSAAGTPRSGSWLGSLLRSNAAKAEKAEKGAER